MSDVLCPDCATLQPESNETCPTCGFAIASEVRYQRAYQRWVASGQRGGRPFGFIVLSGLIAFGMCAAGDATNNQTLEAIGLIATICAWIAGGVMIARWPREPQRKHTPPKDPDLAFEMGVMHEEGLHEDEEGPQTFR